MEIQSFLWMFDVALSFLLILQWCLSSAFAWELSPILILYVWRDDYVGNFCLNILQFCFQRGPARAAQIVYWIYSSFVSMRPGQSRSNSLCGQTLLGLRYIPVCFQRGPVRATKKVHYAGKFIILQFCFQRGPARAAQIVYWIYSSFVSMRPGQSRSNSLCGQTLLGLRYIPVLF